MAGKDVSNVAARSSDNTVPHSNMLLNFLFGQFFMTLFLIVKQTKRILSAEPHIRALWRQVVILTTKLDVIIRENPQTGTCEEYKYAIGPNIAVLVGFRSPEIFSANPLY
jgi:hypothetical protein